MKEHENKHYLIVGASSGIGASVANKLSILGANISLVARRKEKLDAVVRNLKIGSHASYSFDVNNLGDILDLVEQITRERGDIDGFVYCAGAFDSVRLKDLTYELLDRVMTVNFYGFVEFVRSLIKCKKLGHSLRIVGMSSLASVSSDKYFTPYSSSKAAMDAAVRCLSRELIKKNVTINSIRPAVVNVERLKNLSDITGGLDEQIKKNGYQPLGLIPPEDIAAMVSFLLSDGASYITGSCLPFNGGASC